AEVTHGGSPTASAARLRGLMAPSGVRELGAGDAQQQLPKLGRVAQVVLTERGADEEAGQYRLADVLVVHHPVDRRVGESNPGLAANHRSVALHQIGGSLLVSGTDPRQKAGEIFLGHRSDSSTVPSLADRCRLGEPILPPAILAAGTTIASPHKAE